MIALFAALALQVTPAATAASDLDLLKENLARVDRSIEETETLLGRTPTAKYVPELRFRLCELTVEKSRLLYGVQAAQHPDNLGPLVSPEVRLLKEKAVAMYSRMLRELPKYAGNDKVRFYLAHEQRELGHFDEMVDTLTQLVKKSPKSPLAEDAELILGDHFFDKVDLDEAEKHYRAVLRRPPTASHDLARYKLGWIEVNRGNHERAIEQFEAVVTGRHKAPAAATAEEAKKVLDVRREALVDLVFSYTEVRSAKNALAYFERLSDSATTYSLVLDKLASRYLVKQQPEFAVPAFRKMLALRPDPERDEDRVLALYDAIKDTAGKSLPSAQDISFVVRAAVEVRKSVALSADDRTEKLANLEQVARDLSTKLHLQAQKRDDRKLYLEASAAYAEYLALFRPAAHVNEVMKNRADALYAARRYPDAARQFEQLARSVNGSDRKLHEEAMYGALVSYRSSVSDDERLEHLTRYQIVDARQALKRVGAAFVKQYPNNANVADIRFNIARAHFDDGEYKEASQRFMAFALAYPESRDAAIAGHLALDALYKTHDFKKLQSAGQQLLASALPESFKAEARKVLEGVDGEAMTDMALASAEKTGDVIKGLEQVAKDSKDEGTAAKALKGAMLAAREKGDFEKERELAQKLIDEHPDSPSSDDLELSLARRSVDTARFVEAAEWFEKAADVLEGSKSLEALRSAGNLYVAMGELERGGKLLEKVSVKLPRPERAPVLAMLAEEWLQAGDKKRAADFATRAFTADPGNARAAAALAQATGSSRVAQEALASTEGEPAARGLWSLAEDNYDRFAEMQPKDLEQKVAAWQELEQTYTQVIQQGSPEWTVASLWRMGLGYQELATSVLEVPVPKDADKKEYQAAAEEQAAPLRERAEQTFALCVQKADQQGVFTEAAMGCRQKTEDVKLAAFKVTAPAKAGGVPPELQKKVDVTKDAPSLNALAVSWLDKGNPGMARLVFARALEVNKGFVAAQTGLGYSLLQLGEATAAGAAYREALTLEPQNALAHGNLAALKCRFGDATGARAELDQISDKSKLSGPASDPAWKTCSEALSRR